MATPHPAPAPEDDRAADAVVGERWSSARLVRVAGAVAPWLAVLALAAWSAWHRWQVLTMSPHPVGIDGYFYPIQVRALLEHGELAYPASPLTFWLMAGPAAATDPITGAKLVAAIAGALIAIPAFLLGRRLGGAVGGLAAAVVAVTSGGSFYLSLEFVKNGVGLTVATTALWLGARALERPTRGRLIAAALVALAALLAHKMAAAFVAVVLVPAIAVELRGRAAAAGAPRHRDDAPPAEALARGAARREPAIVDARARARGATTRWLIGGGVALIGLTVVLGFLAPSRFVAVRDLAELRGALGDDALWRLPAMYIERPGRPPFALWLGDQAMIAVGLALAWIAASVGARWWSGLASPARPAERAMVWAALAVVGVTAIPILAVGDPDGLGFRLRVAVFAPAAIVAAGVVGRLVAAHAPWIGAAILVPALCVRVATVPAEPRDGLVVAHPALVAGMYALADRLPPDAVVITSERHLGFMAAWYARVPVRLRPDPVPPARRWRLLAGNMIQLGSPLDRALRAARAAPHAPPIGLHARDPDGLVVVPEATWAWVLAQLPERPARYWREWHTR